MSAIQRVARPEPVSQRAVTAFCFCGLPTSGHKPFCIGHVDRLPFVAAVIAERKRREAEDAAQTPFDPHGERADEIVAHVGGQPTLARLAVDLATPKVAVRRYVEALVEAGRLRIVVEVGVKGHTTTRVSRP